MADVKHFQTAALSSATTSNWYFTNTKQNPYNLTVQVALSAGANLTYTVEYTLDDIVNATDSATNVADLPDMTGKTTSDARLLIAPVQAVRLKITSYTSGNATLVLRQAGVNRD